MLYCLQMNTVPLRSIKNVENGSNINLHVKIVRRSQPAGGNLDVVMADNTSAAIGRSTYIAHFSKLEVNQSVYIIDALKKESEVVLTSKTIVARATPLEIEPGMVLPSLPGEEVVSISVALGSPEKTKVSVKGKVIDVRKFSNILR